MEHPFVDIHTHRPTGLGPEPAAAGIHPQEAEAPDLNARIAVLRTVAADAPLIGETGLDFAIGTDPDAQQRLFELQLQLAEGIGKPVVLHCVRAFEQTMRTLARYRLRAVIFHGFIGSSQQALRAVRCGYYLSFGHRTFASPRTTEALRDTPGERLFLETDDTGIAIRTLYEKAAAIRNISVDTLRRITMANYQRIFST